MRKPHSFEIVRYDYDGQDIVIKMIKVLDEKGDYIKFAKLKDVMPYLSKYPVKFKNKNNEKKKHE
mgnify:CR=1 FL=1|tara:strand:+ start:376 stop:570 length:195 start_codon:yes stop_codon:yes gene_type:complete